MCVQFALLLLAGQEFYSSNANQPFYMQILWE